MARLIAVTGATGNQGGSVAKWLLKSPDQYCVRALTRNPQSPAAKKLEQLGAEVIQADLTVASTLPEALRGCWGVFGVTNFYDSTIKDDPGSEERQGKNLVNAALREGVVSFVWSTLPSSAKLSDGRLISRIYEGKHHVDDYIRDTGLPATFVYTGNFYENMIFRSHVKYDREKDMIEFQQPIIRPETQLAMLYVETDLAQITKAIFDNWELKKSKLLHRYLYAADARRAPEDIVASIQKASGKRTIYTPIPTTGVADRDIMFQLYNECGMYQGKEIPDENVLDLGVKFHSIDDFVIDRLLPHLGLEKIPEGQAMNV